MSKRKIKRKLRRLEIGQNVLAGNVANAKNSLAVLESALDSIANQTATRLVGLEKRLRALEPQPEQQEAAQ